MLIFEDRGRLMSNLMDQGAIFQIQGPDEDGSVWVTLSEGPEVWRKNLGPAQDVEIVLRDWLWTLDQDRDQVLK